MTIIDQIIWFAIFLGISILLIWFSTLIRRWVWISSNYGQLKTRHITLKKINRILDENWGVIILVEILVFFIYLIFVTIWIFGEEKMLEGIVFAVGLIIFLSFQLPHLLNQI